MTKQEWALETVAEGIVGAINRFKEERPYALHEMALESATLILQALRSQGAVMKVEGELPDWLMEGQESFDKEDMLKRLKQAGYVAVEPLIEE